MSNRKTGRYDEYAYLLNKYKSRHPMEKWSTESYTAETKSVRIRDYVRMSEYIMDSMRLVGTQRRDLKWLIKNVPLKSLHSKAKIECIILCLCIYIRRSYGDNPSMWKSYKIVKEYGLDCNTLLVVITNLCIWYSRRGVMPRVDNVDKYGTMIEEAEDETDPLTQLESYPKYVYRKILK